MAASVYVNATFYLHTRMDAVLAPFDILLDQPFLNLSGVIEVHAGALCLAPLHHTVTRDNSWRTLRCDLVCAPRARVHCVSRRMMAPQASPNPKKKNKPSSEHAGAEADAVACPPSLPSSSSTGTPLSDLWLQRADQQGARLCHTVTSAPTDFRAQRDWCRKCPPASAMLTLGASCILNLEPFVLTLERPFLISSLSVLLLNPSWAWSKTWLLERAVSVFDFSVGRVVSVNYCS